jgi:His/Glu/Gln/Arg/opine family amino acid ABC transporter permease subunit
VDLLVEYAPLMGQGAVVTIALALASLALATALGVLGAWAKLSGGAVGRGLAGGYTTLVRGVPDLVMIMLIYFGGQRLLNDIGGALGWEYVEVSKFGAGVFSLGFIFGAYLTETFRGAYLSIPAGQIEAARAYGLPKGRMLTRIIGPQLVRFALPGYANVWQVLLKSTAVVSVIGLQDLVGLADKAGKANREPFLFFVVVIFVYLALTSVSGWGFRVAEQRTARGA